MTTLLLVDDLDEGFLVVTARLVLDGGTQRTAVAFLKLGLNGW